MRMRMVCGVLGIACVAMTASAQLVGDPAGPRLGTVYELRLNDPTRADLRDLNRRGFNIGHVSPGHAELYTTPEEFDVLVSEGFDVTVVGQQPDPPNFLTRGARGLGVYHDYAGVTAELQAFHAAYPGITRLISVGQSVQGRELWAIHISDNPYQDEPEPEFKYVSTMHGDEPVGTEMCLYFIDYLLTNYGSDSRITDLVNGTSIWILPLMNPDGLELGTRSNANGFDLNRSFPEAGQDYDGSLYPNFPGLGGLEPEVANLMEWSRDRNFVLSANFHTGAVVVSYPYDSEDGIPDGVPALSPDHTIYLDMSTQYASTNPPMFANNAGPFVNGTVNGNHWFIVEGGMQDWMYRRLGDFETTIELAVPKTPSQASLPQYWNENRESMIRYVEEVHRGIRGTVTDVNTGDPLYAKIEIVGNPQPVASDPDHGDYYRLVPAGTYDVIVSAITYNDVLIEDVVVTGPAATVLDVQLAQPAGLPGPSRWSHALVVVLVALWGAGVMRRRTAPDTETGTAG